VALARPTWAVLLTTRVRPCTRLPHLSLVPWSLHRLCLCTSTSLLRAQCPTTNPRHPPCHRLRRHLAPRHAQPVRVLALHVLSAVSSRRAISVAAPATGADVRKTASWSLSMTKTARRARPSVCTLQQCTRHIGATELSQSATASEPRERFPLPSSDVISWLRRAVFSRLPVSLDGRKLCA
jgi:hypothetical protein